MPDKKREINKRLLLIDGNSYLYRCYYAIKNLSTSKGVPTNAVFGFARLLIKIYRDIKPDYAAVAFDTKKPTFRHKEFEAYKIKREPPPENLIAQIPVVKEMINIFGVSEFELEGFEADDILNLLTAEAEENGIAVTILTGDKDMLQLVNNNVRVMSVHKEDYFYDDKKVLEKFGVTPSQMGDYLSLAGDSSDNIPGVPGVGEKTASTLLKEFTSLENLYKNLDKVKNEKLRERLSVNKESAFFSKKIATLVKPPIKIDFKELTLKNPDAGQLAGFFENLEFKTLREEALKLFNTGDLFLTPDNTIKCEILSPGLFKKEKAVKGMSIDAPGEELLVSVNEKELYAFPKNEPGGKIIGALEDGKIPKTAFDAKKIMHLCMADNIRLEGAVFDCMLAAYLLNPEKGDQDSAETVSIYLNKKTDEKSAVCFFPVLKEKLKVELKNKGLEDLFNKVEMPLVNVLFNMELEGIKINPAFLKKLSGELEHKLTGLVKNIYEMAGGEFNINSPQQLSKVLFEKLKLPVIKKTKTGASTDVEVLEELAKTSALPAVILEYRQLTKLKNTYIDALPEIMDKETHKVHTHYNQAGTSTGRLSSLNPNLQNIPIRSEVGKEIRKAFIPSKASWKLLGADYSQIELRILAHFSGDQNLLDTFIKDGDVHTRTAMEVFDMPKELITSEERRVAKVVNFGIIYGMTPFGLSKELKISTVQAKKYIDRYFERYAGVKRYMEEAKARAGKDGFVETILKRRRYIPDILSKNRMTREFAERIAINAPIQGSASDIIKLAMIKIYDIINKEKLDAKMLLQVHDELIFECPEKEIKPLTKLLKDTMENVIKLRVPVVVDIETGDNWGEV